MADQRIALVQDAAVRLFIRQGFGPTQVSQIAAEAGIATGSVYHLFAGKQALFQYILLETLSPGQAGTGLPYGEISLQVIDSALEQVIESLFSGLSAAERFEDLIRVLFDSAARYQAAFNIINDNPQPAGILYQRYSTAVARLYEVFAQRIEQSIAAGQMRAIEYPGLHIRNILETIVWWAMKLPHLNNSEPISSDKAREIALDILSHAYLAG